MQIFFIQIHPKYLNMHFMEHDSFLNQTKRRLLKKFTAYKQNTVKQKKVAPFSQYTLLIIDYDLGLIFNYLINM